MTNDHAGSEPEDRAGLEIASPSLGARASSAGNGRAGNGPEYGNPDVLSGTTVSGEKATSHHAGETEPTVVDRSHVPPGVLESMRKQVADFADFAHRSRIAPPDSAEPLQALGCNGGITATVVERMAAVLFEKDAVPGLGADQRTQTDSLLLSLVAPEKPAELTERQRELFVSWRGRLALDVSMAVIGRKPVTTVVRLDDHPDRQLPAGDGQVSGASDRDHTTGCAALIVGSAAYIAGDRPYLSLDALMAYARSEVYRPSGPAGAADLQAARNLEIIVLLDRSLGGGLWIDVDRANGRAAAALAIGLSPTRARFTHMPELRIPELRTLAAGIATA
jgi:hypothetical protein